MGSAPSGGPRAAVIALRDEWRALETVTAARVGRIRMWRPSTERENADAENVSAVAPEVHKSAFAPGTERAGEGEREREREARQGGGGRGERGICGTVMEFLIQSGSQLLSFLLVCPGWTDITHNIVFVRSRQGGGRNALGIFVYELTFP